jgi:hypothetical protein
VVGGSERFPYTVGKELKASWSGDCVICGKRYRRGSKIFKPENRDNPFLPIPGYGCSSCLLLASMVTPRD